MLVTSNNGHFATFECLGGFIDVEVTGNGIVGEITSGYGKSSTFNVAFAIRRRRGRQRSSRHRIEVDETPETTYHLFSSINGGEPGTAIEEAEGTIHFAEEVTLTKT